MLKGITLNQLKDKYDVVVIGSGIGGLVCANYLAKAGKSVLVIERHFLPGGLCTSFRRKGFVFDSMASMITGLGINRLSSIAMIIKDLELEVSFKRINYSIIFPDTQIQINESDQLKEGLIKKY
ncbi:phytoene desaturase family protein [Candidatus Margulisiibacteriota bacterium]